MDPKIGYLLEIGEKSLKLDGKPFYLASGDMHYFRYLKGGWKRRLKLMKDFGLTAVQTYVPWNLHEKHEGEFDFSENLDLAAFLELCDELGLKVMFRPSPYMCTEWNFGGLPYWLLSKKGIGIIFDPSCVNWIIKKGYSLEYGARPLKDVIRNYITDLISDRLVAGDLNSGDNIRLVVINDEIDYQFC